MTMQSPAPATKARRRKVAPRCTCPVCIGGYYSNPQGVFYCTADREWSAYASGQFIAANSIKALVDEALAVYLIDQAAAESVEVAAAAADIEHDVQQASTDADVVAALAAPEDNEREDEHDREAYEEWAHEQDADVSTPQPSTETFVVWSQFIKNEQGDSNEPQLCAEELPLDEALIKYDLLRRYCTTGAAAPISDPDRVYWIEADHTAADAATHAANAATHAANAATHAANAALPQLPPPAYYNRHAQGFIFEGCTETYETMRDAVYARDGRL